MPFYAAAVVSAIGHCSSTRIDPTLVGRHAFVVALLPVATDPAAASAAPSAFLSFAARIVPNLVPSSNTFLQLSPSTVSSCCL